MGNTFSNNYHIAVSAPQPPESSTLALEPRAEALHISLMRMAFKFVGGTSGGRQPTHFAQLA